jgi:hypothetical protein
MAPGILGTARGGIGLGGAGRFAWNAPARPAVSKVAMATQLRTIAGTYRHRAAARPASWEAIVGIMGRPRLGEDGHGDAVHATVVTVSLLSYDEEFVRRLTLGERKGDDPTQGGAADFR